jgi:hypothetical protein
MKPYAIRSRIAEMALSVALSAGSVWTDMSNDDDF